MTPILGFLLVLLIAFVTVNFVAPRLRESNPLVSGVVVSGIPFLVLGIILGPKVSNFLSRDILVRLEPLVSLALGWIGLIFGIQLRWRNVKRFPRNYLLFTSIQSLVAFAVIGGFSFWALRWLQGTGGREVLEIALVLGAVGCVTAPITIGRAVATLGARGRLTHLLQFVSGLDGFWGILFAGVGSALFNPLKSPVIHSGWQWFLLGMGLALLMGVYLLYLLRSGFSAEENFLLLLGLVVFVSGAGFYLHLSPIFLNMVVGMVVAQSRIPATQVNRIVVTMEKPLYLMLLVFAGAMWNPAVLPEVGIIAAFLLARLMGKLIGGWISARWIPVGFPVPARIGHLLLSFGGVSLAIAFNYQLFRGGSAGGLVISATIIGIILFDELAAWNTFRLLRQEGEIS
ncbi:MAG: hypothetical protein D6715_14560 [Calditrichaeota bacterium]|nr:MAG: hypothetical protein D6715_14560 [Calditrichota bacterium]